jgi:hypothetical protein
MMNKPVSLTQWKCPRAEENPKSDLPDEKARAMEGELKRASSY